VDIWAAGIIAAEVWSSDGYHPYKELLAAMLGADDEAPAAAYYAALSSATPVELPASSFGHCEQWQLDWLRDALHKDPAQRADVNELRYADALVQHACSAAYHRQQELDAQGGAFRRPALWAPQGVQVHASFWHGDCQQLQQALQERQRAEEGVAWARGGAQAAAAAAHEQRQRQAAGEVAGAQEGAQDAAAAAREHMQAAGAALAAAHAGLAAVDAALAAPAAAPAPAEAGAEEPEGGDGGWAGGYVYVGVDVHQVGPLGVGWGGGELLSGQAAGRQLPPGRSRCTAHDLNPAQMLGEHP
jgi:hypothetical protein